MNELHYSPYHEPTIREKMQRLPLKDAQGWLWSGVMLLPIRYRFGKLDDGRKISFFNLLILKMKMVGVERRTTDPITEPISKITSRKIKYLQNSYFHHTEPIYLWVELKVEPFYILNLVFCLKYNPLSYNSIFLKKSGKNTLKYFTNPL